jgi:hypothetical protein
MVVTQNYDIYFPIQLWTFHDGTKYRFQPPLLGYTDEYRFLPFFWDDLSLSSQHVAELQSQWTLRHTFWAYNPKYHLSMNRGMNTVLILQNNKEFPYASQQVKAYRDDTSIFENMETYANSFGFCVYTYPVPTTSLLYVQVQLFTTEIIKVVLCDGKTCPVLSRYAFLPNATNNETVPCTEILVHDTNVFWYVFSKRPSGHYFRLTSQQLCVPSDDPRDFPSFFDCMRQGVSSRVNPSNIFTGSTIPELQQVMYTFPNSNDASWMYGLVQWPLIFLGLMSLVMVYGIGQRYQRGGR